VIIPFSSSSLLKVSNSCLSMLFVFRAFLKSQIVLPSGTLSPTSRSRKCIKESRSFIWYFVCMSAVRTIVAVW